MKVIFSLLVFFAAVSPVFAMEDKKENGASDAVVVKPMVFISLSYNWNGQKLFGACPDRGTDFEHAGKVRDKLNELLAAGKVLPEGKDNGVQTFRMMFPIEYCQENIEGLFEQMARVIVEKNEAREAQGIEALLRQYFNSIQQPDMKHLSVTFPPEGNSLYESPRDFLNNLSMNSSHDDLGSTQQPGRGPFIVTYLSEGDSGDEDPSYEGPSYDDFRDALNSLSMNPSRDNSTEKEDTKSEL